MTAELAFAGYRRAIAAGVDAFLRNDKYQLWLAGDDAFAAYADDPMGGGGRGAFRVICGDDNLNPGIAAFAHSLGDAGPVLLPALVMEATADDTGGPDPWSLPAAVFVAPSHLDDPMDPETGARPYLEGHRERRDAITACAIRKADIDRRLHQGGARYLAGRAAPSCGMMPGSGLHVELRLLQGIGLTPREALAAATGNFANAYRWRDRGLVAQGRRADLVLLRVDPRADIGAVDPIGHRGRKDGRPNISASECAAIENAAQLARCRYFQEIAGRRADRRRVADLPHPPDHRSHMRTLWL